MAGTLPGVVAEMAIFGLQLPWQVGSGFPSAQIEHWLVGVLKNEAAIRFA
jgi:hypothetical protein